MEGRRTTVTVTQTKLGIAIGARKVDGAKYVFIKSVTAGSELEASGVQAGWFVVGVNGADSMKGIVAALKTKDRPLTVVCVAPSGERDSGSSAAAPAVSASAADGSVDQTKPERPAHDPPASLKAAAAKAKVLLPSVARSTVVVTQAKLGLSIGARSAAGTKYIYVKTVQDGSEAAAGGVTPDYHVMEANGATDMKGIVAALKTKERPLTIVFAAPARKLAASADSATVLDAKAAASRAANAASEQSTAAPSATPVAPSGGAVSTLIVTQAKLGISIGAKKVNGMRHVFVKTVSDACEAAAAGVQPGYYITGANGASDMKGIVAALKTKERPLTITFAAPDNVNSSAADTPTSEVSAADGTSVDASPAAAAPGVTAESPLPPKADVPVVAATREAVESAASEPSGPTSSSEAGAPPPGAVSMRPTATRAETAQAETARAEAAQAEATQAEAAKSEAGQAEAIKAENAQAEAVELEAAQAEAEHVEAAQAEAARAEAERVEAERVEAERVEAAREEAAQAEAARVVAARVEAARVKAARAAAVQVDATAAAAQVEGDRQKRAAVERAVTNAVNGVEETQPDMGTILETDARASAKVSQDAAGAREEARAKADTDRQFAATAATKENAAAIAASAAAQVAREQVAVNETAAHAARANDKKQKERERQLAGAAVIPSRRNSLIGALAKGASGVRRSLKRGSIKVPDAASKEKAAKAQAQATQKKTVQVRFRIADQLHELWRKPRRLPDGKYEPRWKRTDEGDFDIANLRFIDLPSVYQKANLHAGHLACGFVELGFADMKRVGSSGFLEEASEHQHIDWLKENPWCTDPLQTCTYDELSEYEKQKDREIVLIARKELTGYFRRLYKVSNPDISFEEFARDLAKFAITLRSSGKLDADSDVMEIWSDALRAVKDGGVGAPAAGKKRRGSVAAMLGHIEKTSRGRRRMSIVPKKRMMLRSSSRFTTEGSVSKLNGVKLKRGGMKWQPRHFFLQGHYLMYKKKSSDADYADGVDLRGPESSLTMSDEQTVCVQGLSAEEDEGGERTIRSMELRIPKGDATNITKWFKNLSDHQIGLRVSTFLTASSSESTSSASGSSSDATGVAAHVAAVKREHEVEAIVTKVMIRAQRRYLATALVRFNSAIATAVAAEMRLDRQAKKLKKVTVKCEATKMKVLVSGKWQEWVAYASACARQEAAANMRAEAAVEAAAKEAAAAALDTDSASFEDLPGEWSEDEVASDLESDARGMGGTAVTATSDESVIEPKSTSATRGRQSALRTSRRQTSATRGRQSASRTRVRKPRSRISRAAASSSCRALTAIDDALIKCSVFACLPESQTMQIADRCFTLAYNDGERIIAQGETNATRWYVVASGEVAVHKATTRSPVGYQCLLGEGQLFGEQALLSKSPRTASVFARGATTVVVLSQDLFETHMRPLERILEVHNTVRLQDEQLAEMRSEQHRGAVEAARQRAAAAQAELDRRAARVFSEEQRAEYDRVALALRVQKLRAAEELEFREQAAEELRKRSRMREEAATSFQTIDTEAKTPQRGEHDAVSTFWSAFNSISGEAGDVSPQAQRPSKSGAGFEDAELGARVLSSRRPYDSAADGPLALGLRFSQRSGALARAATSPSGAPGAAPSAAPLPRVEAGWVMHRDESTGVTYWWNVETRETRWFPPLADGASGKSVVGSPLAQGTLALGRSGRYIRTPNPTPRVELPQPSMDRSTPAISTVTVRPVASPPRALPVMKPPCGELERSAVPGLQNGQSAPAPTRAEELSALRAELVSARAQLASARGIAPPEF